jgi:hypothetical protein
MHYVTCRAHQMQKHKFGEMYRGKLFVESVLVSLEPENSTITFHAADARSAVRDP